MLPAISYKEKMFLKNNYSTLDHSLLSWVFTYYFTKIFVHLSIIAALSYFSVYNLISWIAANIYLFKFNSRTLEKIVNYERQRCSIKKAAPEDFAIFAEKTESLLNRLTGFKTCNFLKKRLQYRCFPVNIAKFLRTLILVKIWKQLLLPFLLLAVNISF